MAWPYRWYSSRRRSPHPSSTGPRWPGSWCNNAAGIKNFKFVVSGHTDTSGSVAHNKELSARRAAVIQRELVKRGVAASDIESLGMGSERPLVKPDDTPAKKARNRRYEIQVKL